MSARRPETTMHKACTNHAYARCVQHSFTPEAAKIAAAGLTFLALALAALPARAQVETFSLPPGCEAFLTVQGADCSVDHHFTCTGDPEGHKQRISLDERGITYLGTTDEQTQWISSFHPLSGHSERLGDSPADPANLDELLANGRDSYDFLTLSEEVGETRYVGQDRLTGRVITIDEVDLQETEFNITAYDADGTEMWSTRGNEFVSADWRMFLAGTGVTTTPEDRFERDGSPVEFIFPGETGFLSANPKHGCGVVTSSFEVGQ